MIWQLIYASRPFGFDDLALSGILATARANNLRDDITGALICRDDVYLQLLEGDHDKVAATFERIRRDDRHTEIHKLSDGTVEARVFANWAMRHDPVRSWMWTRQQVAADLISTATSDDAKAIFQRLSAEPGDAEQRCPRHQIE